MEKGVYTEVETEAFLKHYLPVAKNRLVKTVKELQEAARAIRFPLVLKIISKKALHKSDINGVRLVKTKADLEEEFLDLMKVVRKKRLPLEGILVQQWVRGEYVLLGLKQDPVFGPVLACGIGGVYTELLHDVAFRVCPITERDATAMLEELQMKQLLSGFRGSKVNKRVLKQAMVKLSRVAISHPEILELDINPFVVNEREGFVVDARMRV